MAKTANDLAYDATLRHQVELLRFTEAEAEAAIELLKDAEAELLAAIQVRFSSGLDADRLEALLTSALRRREEAFAEVLGRLEDSGEQLAGIEAEWEAQMLERVSPVKLVLAEVSIAHLKALVSNPIQGLSLKGWLDKVSDDERLQLQRAVSMAMTQGETVDQLTARIRGTRAANYEDGILTATRRNAAALARTSMNHVANAAREGVWEANSDVVRALRWTSTLDGRTTDICRARDGKLAPLGRDLLPGDNALLPPGARPPAHFNCRSVMVPVLDGQSLAAGGDRPYVADDRTRREREAAFRAEAKERGVPISQVRSEWADERVGRVPAATTYPEWLRGQSERLQDSILGPERAQLFREGMSLDRFVDFSGRRLTLDELRSSLKDALDG